MIAALVMKLVDMRVLGTRALARVGSSPTEGKRLVYDFCMIFGRNVLPFQTLRSLRSLFQGT